MDWEINSDGGFLGVLDVDLYVSGSGVVNDLFNSVFVPL